MRIKKCYNKAGFALIIQMLIASTVSSVITVIYAVAATVKIMLEDGVADPNQVGETVGRILRPDVVLFITAISYLVANVASYFLGNAMLKKQYNAKIFNKISMKPLDCILAVLSVIGIQMLSMLIQSLIIIITGVNGVTEETMQMLSFSDNAFQNITLVLYTVVVAAFTEELVCRGMVMKALSPVSTRFAVLASALLFGIMHGNFNQMLNGFMLGLVFGYAAVKSKSIVLPVILHMVANGHAMLLSFLEYKFAESIVVFEGIYIVLMAVVGTVAAVILYIRLSKPNDQEDGFPCTLPLWGLDMLENKRGLTWKLLFKTPCFWIFTVIYLLTAISSISFL